MDDTGCIDWDTGVGFFAVVEPGDPLGLLQHALRTGDPATGKPAVALAGHGQRLVPHSAKGQAPQSTCGQLLAPSSAMGQAPESGLRNTSEFQLLDRVTRLVHPFPPELVKEDASITKNWLYREAVLTDGVISLNIYTYLSEIGAGTFSSTAHRVAATPETMSSVYASVAAKGQVEQLPPRCCQHHCHASEDQVLHVLQGELIIRQEEGTGQRRSAGCPGSRAGLGR